MVEPHSFKRCSPGTGPRISLFPGIGSFLWDMMVLRLLKLPEASKTGWKDLWHLLSIVWTKTCQASSSQHNAFDILCNSTKSLQSHLRFGDAWCLYHMFDFFKNPGYWSWKSTCCFSHMQPKVTRKNCSFCWGTIGRWCSWCSFKLRIRNRSWCRRYGFHAIQVASIEHVFVFRYIQIFQPRLLLWTFRAWGLWSFNRWSPTFCNHRLNRSLGLAFCNLRRGNWSFDPGCGRCHNRWAWSVGSGFGCSNINSGSRRTRPSLQPKFPIYIFFQYFMLTKLEIILIDPCIFTSNLGLEQGVLLCSSHHLVNLNVMPFK